MRQKVPSLFEPLIGGGAEGSCDLEDGDVVPQFQAVLGDGHPLLNEGTSLTRLVTGQDLLGDPQRHLCVCQVGRDVLLCFIDTMLRGVMPSILHGYWPHIPSLLVLL